MCVISVLYNILCSVCVSLIVFVLGSLTQYTDLEEASDKALHGCACVFEHKKKNKHENPSFHETAHFVFLHSTDVDDCLCDPCQNGGTCHNYPGGYWCDCVEGITGPNCCIGN